MNGMTREYDGYSLGPDGPRFESAEINKVVCAVADGLKDVTVYDYTRRPWVVFIGQDRVLFQEYKPGGQHFVIELE